MNNNTNTNNNKTTITVLPRIASSTTTSNNNTTTNNNNNNTTTIKVSKSTNNSVETTERCSSDGTDPIFITTTTTSNHHPNHNQQHSNSNTLLISRTTPTGFPRTIPTNSTTTTQINTANTSSSLSHLPVLFDQQQQQQPKQFVTNNKQQIIEQSLVPNVTTVSSHVHEHPHHQQQQYSTKPPLGITTTTTTTTTSTNSATRSVGSYGTTKKKATTKVVGMEHSLPISVQQETIHRSTATSVPNTTTTTTTTRSSSVPPTGVATNVQQPQHRRRLTPPLSSSSSSSLMYGTVSPATATTTTMTTNYMNNNESNSSPTITTTTTTVPNVNNNKTTTTSIGMMQQQQQQQPTSIEIQEQILFEQRMNHDPLGLAIRKINQYGKSNLRYVKCITIVGTLSGGHHIESSRTYHPTSSSVSSSGVQQHRTSITGTSSIGSNHSSSHWSVGRRSMNHSSMTNYNNIKNNSNTNTTTSYKVLSWGKKKDVQIPLKAFVAVKKGKTTDRAKRCSHVPSSRIVSIITNDIYHPSLDIEAPTTLDRNKFARAFARYLNIPLYEEDNTILQLVPLNTQISNSNNSNTILPLSWNTKNSIQPQPASTAQSDAVVVDKTSTTAFVPIIQSGTDDGLSSTAPKAASVRPNNNNNMIFDHYSEHPIVATAFSVAPSSLVQQLEEDSITMKVIQGPLPVELQHQLNNNSSTAVFVDPVQGQRDNHNNDDKGPTEVVEERGGGAIVSLIPDIEKDHRDDHSHMSSLTGHGYDQELVEELHHALNELRAELEESRAEASRAVKVAEQAIQSAERSNSIEWQNTVTHKAAEAAALAQKRSAAAMAKQRLAEERLESERRSATFWRKQAEIAEEEAGTLQTRAAAAEVQRSAMEERLHHERRIAAEQISSLRGRYTSTDLSQRDALESALERNHALELELDATRQDLLSKQNELQMILVDNQMNDDDNNKNRKLKRNFGRNKKRGSGDIGHDSTSLLSDNVLSSSSALTSIDQSENRVPTNNLEPTEGLTAEQVLKIHAETQLMRQQFEMLKRATADHLEQLPDNVRVWGQQISQSLQNSQAEVARLQAKLAMESASRRKLLHEVQDLRGAIRVYCRPMPSVHYKELITLPSHDSIVFHRDKYDDVLGPVSFEFDRVFDPNTPHQQQDVYSEIQDVCLGVLEGYNICLMSFGPSNCGKTTTMLGDTDMATYQIQNHGIHLQAMDQLFTIAQHRSERYKDIFTLTIIEVRNERIRDLVAATETGSRCGHVMIAETKNGVTTDRKIKATTMQETDDASSGRPSKLEIRTDIHGDTVIQGLVAVEVNCMDDVINLWQDCIAVKARRVNEHGMDLKQYDTSNHIIATLRVKSTNIATGIGTIGKIQFVDLAAADVVPRTGNSSITNTQQDVLGGTDGKDVGTATLMNQADWKFANKSLETFSDCIEARMQFDRNVPYRNSTLTHLLRDSLEADTKVLIFACVSSDPANLHETVAVLKFASQLRRVIIGRATKHTLNA